MQVPGQGIACLSICAAVYNTAQRAQFPVLQVRRGGAWEGVP